MPVLECRFVRETRQEPGPENSCRDVLLSDLKMQLPEGVDAQPEGQYANDNRADIRIAYQAQGFEIPVEVKKNTSPDLWGAPRDQLIAKYTLEPATGGHGIYLVLWFGKDHAQPTPPSGAPPANAQELKARLQATLTHEETRKITVCVTDVSSPGGREQKTAGHD